MVICLERGADLHVAQLMPLTLTVSCFSKIQIDFTFLVPAHLGSPRKGPLIVCVCVCFISKRYLYFSIGNGQPREPALLPIVSTHLLLLCAMLLQCLVTATVDRCRLPPHAHSGNRPHAAAEVDRWGRQTERGTDTVPLHRPRHTLCKQCQ